MQRVTIWLSYHYFTFSVYNLFVFLDICKSHGIWIGHNFVRIKIWKSFNGTNSFKIWEYVILLKGNFGRKRKNYHMFLTYRTVAGKNFRSQNLKEKSAGPFHPLLSSLFVLTFLLTFLNLCTRLLNFSTHFTKPEYKFIQV